MKNPRGRLLQALLLLTVLLAAAVRFWGIGFGLPHTQARPDETYIIDVTLALLRGRFPPPNYDYPWLYALLLTALYIPYYFWGLLTGFFHSFSELPASWPIRWAPFFLISRSVSAVAGTLTVYVVYRIGRRLWNGETGLVAAFLLSLTFLHVRDSHYGTTDVLMTLLIVTAVGILMHAHRTGHLRSFVLAGIVAGLAAGTKYNAAMLAAPVLLGQAIHVLDSPGRRVRSAIDGRLWFFGIPCVIAFLLAAPFIVLDTHSFFRALDILKQSMQTGNGALELESGWIHHFKLSLRYGLGLPLLLAALGGMALVFFSEWRTGVMLFSFPLAYYLVAGSSRNQFFRYVIPVVPFLCLAAARAIARAVEELKRRELFGSGHMGRYAPPVTLAVIAVVIVLPSAQSVWQFDRILSQTDNRVVISQWFAEHVPTGSSVLQSGSFYGHAQFDQRLQYKYWSWDRSGRRFLVNGQTPEGRPDWILLQESPLPNTTQDIVTEFLRDDYVFAYQFQAMSLKDQNRIFDQEDAFFVPFAGFDGVRRPGPNFTLYRRADVPVSDDTP